MFDLEVLLKRSAIKIDEKDKKGIENDLISLIALLNELPEPINNDISYSRFLNFACENDQKEASRDDILLNAKNKKDFMFKVPPR
jgi:hypothetical protein